MRLQIGLFLRKLGARKEGGGALKTQQTLTRSIAVCCGRRTRKIENDDLNRRASAMSIELVRRRSSINYDNLPVNRV